MNQMNRKSYSKLTKSIQQTKDKLNKIKTSPEWLEIIQNPAAHPDLITDFVACVAAFKDLSLHIDLSIHSIQGAENRQTQLLKEIHQEAA